MPIRRFEKDDLPALAAIVRATDVFRPEEIEVAIELMEVAAADPGQKEYEIFTYVDESAAPRGYYCMGSTPLTKSTFDLYWIAVDPALHGKGVGKELLQHCESVVQSMGGKLIMVETSSLPKYGAARKLYVRNRYAEEARVRDYYAPGDDLIVYSKHITEA